MLTAGVDEVGRGCLAGEVVSAAVILPVNHGILGLNDSKKLREHQRDYSSNCHNYYKCWLAVLDVHCSLQELGY